ncbi:hypothetical protein DFH09DRAFT_1106367 [Mycena vulgaris]|nr:hypothetical protein DFH09DRAFT_1106367 [Mycena vulgaris]
MPCPRQFNACTSVFVKNKAFWVLKCGGRQANVMDSGEGHNSVNPLLIMPIPTTRSAVALVRIGTDTKEEAAALPPSRCYRRARWLHPGGSRALPRCAGADARAVPVRWRCTAAHHVVSRAAPAHPRPARDVRSQGRDAVLTVLRAAYLDAAVHNGIAALWRALAGYPKPYFSGGGGGGALNEKLIIEDQVINCIGNDRNNISKRTLNQRGILQPPRVSGPLFPLRNDKSGVKMERVRFAIHEEDVLERGEVEGTEYEVFPAAEENHEAKIRRRARGTAQLRLSALPGSEFRIGEKNNAGWDFPQRPNNSSKEFKRKESSITLQSTPQLEPTHYIKIHTQPSNTPRSQCRYRPPTSSPAPQDAAGLVDEKRSKPHQSAP